MYRKLEKLGKFGLQKEETIYQIRVDWDDD